MEVIEVKLFGSDGSFLSLQLPLHFRGLRQGYIQYVLSKVQAAVEMRENWGQAGMEERVQTAPSLICWIHHVMEQSNGTTAKGHHL